MKALSTPVPTPNAYVEFFHRAHLDALRAEGERLRAELRRHGVDPVLFLRARARPATRKKGLNPC